MARFGDLDALSRRLDRRDAARRAADRRSTTPAAVQNELGTRELCHDLRQPLASATLLTAALDREAGLSAEGRSRLDALRAALHRLSDMLVAHLDPPAPVPVDLAALAGQVQSELGTQGPELMVEARPVVAGDPVLLARALTNLAINARQAAGDDGRVRVVVRASAAEASLEVEDSGPGHTDSSPSGHGLGLLIAERVAAQHGGGLHCGASTLGGLRVRLVLPVAQPEPGDVP